jgi:DNA-binding transcriptional MerR regulator
VELDLITSSDASRIANVTPNCIRLWADAGKLPMIRTGNGIRLFNRADVQALAAERTARKTASLEPVAATRLIGP